MSKIPKLDTKTARLVNSAEGGSRVLVDEDQYRLKLSKVIVSPKPDRNGNTYWVWSWDVISGQQSGDKWKGKSVRCNTGFTDDQAFFPKMIFDSFGAKPNVDTDTLIGQELLAIVGQREIASGARKGQITNDITAFMSLDAGGGDDADWADDGKTEDTKAADSDDDDSDPDF